MLPFYIFKRKNGYYKISFTDSETGLIVKQKSSHSKIYSEAFALANKWLCNGIPEGRIDARKKRQTTNSTQNNIDVNKLSNEEALELLKQLNEKFGLSVTEQAVEKNITAEQNEPAKHGLNCINRN